MDILLLERPDVSTLRHLDVWTSGRWDSYENGIKEELYFDNFWGYPKSFLLLQIRKEAEESAPKYSEIIVIS